MGLITSMFEPGSTLSVIIEPYGCPTKTKTKNFSNIDSTLIKGFQHWDYSMLSFFTSIPFVWKPSEKKGQPTQISPPLRCVNPMTFILRHVNDSKITSKLVFRLILLKQLKSKTCRPIWDIYHNKKAHKQQPASFNSENKFFTFSVFGLCFCFV